MNYIVKPIILTGDDSISFANNIYFPTEEQMKLNAMNYYDVINNVTVTSDENGFVAAISDLDLSGVDISALLNEKKETRLEFDVTISIGAKELLSSQYDGCSIEDNLSILKKEIVSEHKVDNGMTYAA